LHAYGAPQGEPVLALLEAAPDVVVGRNEPYPGHLPGDLVDRHALHHGRLNALIEVRNDLITDPQHQQAWGERLAPLLERALDQVPD